MVSDLFNYLYFRTKPAANNVVMILVEMYLTFIRDRPKYVCDIKNVGVLVLSFRH